MLSAALDSVGLSRESNERARTFSAGMRRRLVLARVVLRPPRLLLLDEPYANFDADGIALVNRFVQQIQREGGAVVLATHDLERVAPVADRTITLAAGRATEPGPPSAGRFEPEVSVTS
jgi:tungstate transport system ATP-binding protein